MTKASSDVPLMNNKGFASQVGKKENLTTGEKAKTVPKSTSVPGAPRGSGMTLLALIRSHSSANTLKFKRLHEK